MIRSSGHYRELRISKLIKLDEIPCHISIEEKPSEAVYSTSNYFYAILEINSYEYKNR